MDEPICGRRIRHSKSQWWGVQRFRATKQNKWASAYCAHPSTTKISLLPICRTVVFSHQTLFDRIPEVPNSTWSLFHCASASSNCLVRVVRPKLVGAAGSCLCPSPPSSHWAAWASLSATRTRPLRILGQLGQTISP